MVCLAPRALGDSVRPRRPADVVARPLNFTVRCLDSVVSLSSMKPLDRATRLRLDLWISGVLGVLYLADVAVHYRFAFALIERQFGTSPWAKLFLAAPVVLVGLVLWYRLSREAHQSSTAPNNRWRGP